MPCILSCFNAYARDTHLTKLTKGTVAANGLLPSVVKIINENWQPGDQSTEIAYRDSLLDFLRDTAPEGCQVEREYRHGGTTTDIFVSWKGFLSNDELFIEIKRNLEKKAAFDRLIGQLEELGPGKHKIILVLVGNTDRGLLGRLKARYSRFIDYHLFGPEMAIIVKGGDKDF